MTNKAFTLRRFADTFGVVQAALALVKWFQILGVVRFVRAVS